MKRASAESIATWATMSVLSLTVVVVGPYLQTADLERRLLGALVAIPSLAFVYSAIRKAVARHGARKLLGYWLYVTFPHDPAKRRNNVSFGLMCFDLDDLGDLRYSVLLFDNPKSLMEAARNGFSSKGAVGRAWNQAIAYDERKQCVWILYEAAWNSPDKPNRTGHLYVDLSSPNRLSGHWASDIGKQQLSAGEIHVARSRNFEKMLSELRPLVEAGEPGDPESGAGRLPPGRVDPGPAPK